MQNKLYFKSIYFNNHDFKLKIMNKYNYSL